MADASLVGMDESALELMTVVQLRDHLKKRSLPTGGNKPALVHRLAEYIKSAENQILGTEDHDVIGEGAVDGSSSNADLSEDAVLGLAPGEVEPAAPAAASDEQVAVAADDAPAEEPPAADADTTAAAKKPSRVPITVEGLAPAAGATTGGKIALRGPPDVPAPIEAAAGGGDSEEERRRLARAKKFGTPLAAESRAAIRAERFGTGEPAKGETTTTATAAAEPAAGADAEKRRRRAERFGATAAVTETTTTTVTGAGDDKLSARKARFDGAGGKNTGTVSIKTVSSAPSDGTLAKRRQRFGEVAAATGGGADADTAAGAKEARKADDAGDEADAKKARRAARFGNGVAA